MKIREATKLDLVKLIQLASQFYSEFSKPDYPAFSAENIALHFSVCISRPDRCLLVCDDNSDLQGFISGRIQNVEWADALEGVHDYLYVSRENRGFGFGAQLSGRFIEWVEKFGTDNNKDVWNISMGFRYSTPENVVRESLKASFKKSGFILSTR